MATLATHFGLGNQTHRSLDDVRMNLEVIKYCATVLFLESSLPDVLTNTNIPSSVLMFTDHQAIPPLDVDNNVAKQDPFNISLLIDQVIAPPTQHDTNMDEEIADAESPEIVVNTISSESSSGHAGFLEPDEVALAFVQASFFRSRQGTQRIQLLHKDVILQLSSSELRVRFGISTKFLDQAGRPRLSIVVDPSPSLCKVLDDCNYHAQKLFTKLGSSSEWRSVVTRKNGFLNSPTIRLHIPTLTSGDTAVYATEIYQKEASGNPRRIIFSKFDATELDSLFTPGTFVDAFFCLDVYDFQQLAGIRLVAKKFIIHSK